MHLLKKGHPKDRKPSLLFTLLALKGEEKLFIDTQLNPHFISPKLILGV